MKLITQHSEIASKYGDAWAEIKRKVPQLNFVSMEEDGKSPWENEHGEDDQSESVATREVMDMRDYLDQRGY